MYDVFYSQQQELKMLRLDVRSGYFISNGFIVPSSHPKDLETHNLEYILKRKRGHMIPIKVEQTAMMAGPLLSGSTKLDFCPSGGGKNGRFSIANASRSSLLG